MNKAQFKKLRSKLNSVMEEINTAVEEREWRFEGRSDKWQESDKGDEYGVETEQFKIVAETIECAISELDEIQ